MFLRFSKFKLFTKQKKIFAISAGFVLGSALALGWNWGEYVSCNDASSSISNNNSNAIDLSSLPVYSKEDVRAHASAANRIWVTYKDGVYDITDFVAEHPGGAKIMLAAGGAVDPFWALYAAHQKEEVRRRLGFCCCCCCCFSFSLFLFSFFFSTLHSFCNHLTLRCCSCLRRCA
jgi:hypothetical protein